MRRSRDPSTQQRSYHIAEAGQKAQLRVLFEALADTLKENAADANDRALLKRSPLPGEKALHVGAWLAANRARLTRALANGDLFELVFEFVRAEGMPAAFQSMSDNSIALTIGEMWFDERPYVDIFHEMQKLDLRIGGNNRRVSLDDAVSFCENGFGYEVAMIVATMADALEEVDEDVAAALSLFEKRTFRLKRSRRPLSQRSPDHRLPTIREQDRRDQSRADAVPQLPRGPILQIRGQ